MPHAVNAPSTDLYGHGVPFIKLTHNKLQDVPQGPIF